MQMGKRLTQRHGVEIEFLGFQEIPESPLDKIEMPEFPLEAKTNQLDLLNNVKEAYVLEVDTSLIFLLSYLALQAFPRIQAGYF